jgi:hypothetical protein
MKTKYVIPRSCCSPPTPLIEYENPIGYSWTLWEFDIDEAGGVADLLTEIPDSSNIGAANPYVTFAGKAWIHNEFSTPSTFRVEYIQQLIIAVDRPGDTLPLFTRIRIRFYPISSVFDPFAQPVLIGESDEYFPEMIKIGYAQDELINMLDLNTYQTIKTVGPIPNNCLPIEFYNENNRYTVDIFQNEIPLTFYLSPSQFFAHFVFRMNGPFPSQPDFPNDGIEIEMKQIIGGHRLTQYNFRPAEVTLYV